MGVASDGSYGVPEGLFFSMPVTCRGGQWQIVQVSMKADSVDGFTDQSLLKLSHCLPKRLFISCPSHAWLQMSHCPEDS